MRKCAWIVEWDSLMPDRYPAPSVSPHILPYRWSDQRVLDYIAGYFWNSTLWTPWETLNQIHRQKPTGIFIENRGPWKMYGRNPFVIGVYVSDLEIERQGQKVVMRWTRLPKKVYDPKTRSEKAVGEIVYREYVFQD